jgi:glycerate kinase
MISRTVFVAPESFGGELGAARVAAAIGRGLRAGDPSLEVDLCPIEGDGPGEGDTPGRRGEPREGHRSGDARELIDALDLDARLHRARAVVVGARRLDEGTLLGSATFELATRARQGGVPAYAVAMENALSLFDARILDLQTILEARDTAGLRRAGKRLAEIV